MLLSQVTLNQQDTWIVFNGAFTKKKKKISPASESEGEGTWSHSSTEERGRERNALIKKTPPHNFHHINAL